MRALAVAVVAACGGSPAKSAPEPAPEREVLVKKHDLSELARPETPKLLSIDWSTVKLDSNADALALWARIAPTGLDWQDKLQELPDVVERPLAIALIEGGNFTCMPAVKQQDCARTQFDVKEPAHAAGFADPCLRRLLAIWAIDKLDDADLPKLRDPLRAIVQLPPPESELVATVLATIPEHDHAMRLEQDLLPLLATVDVDRE